MRKLYFPFIAVVFLLLSAVCARAQKSPLKKYPSLFWEITGNGLQKPSYLFGTMHVSSKMVFHLSDSFYYAMKNVDAVALELNPDLWQGQMVRLDRLKENYANFTQSPGGDFLNEQSFRNLPFESALKAALSTEPTVVNNLLYRSYKAREDFEEDTFLDMYIFQTGKKLGKRSAGVEDYYETEKVVLEAYADMAKEKKKKNIDMDGESMRDIGQQIQDAYRTGDLDLMDSLDLLTERSDAFREKFLYKRNEIQACSIDTIIKRSSLFVGVGAAHLPGQRGIIEILRNMGYTLRPITMTNRDAVKKEETDQLKVPVVFSKVQAEDGFYSVSMPGPLFKMKDDFQRLDRKQYADMSNGCYYLVTRVKTSAGFIGQSVTAVLKKVDSLLYENIPGKIISKKAIERNGHPGFDITNKTRRGDLQRYHIFITPFEIIVFKMSGKENYVDGSEAARFFSSILFNNTPTSPVNFSPHQGGFSIALPHWPHTYLNSGTTDDIKRWEYEANDATNGDAYLIYKKSVFNFKFLEEDTFDLKLLEASFHSPEYFDKQVKRRLFTWLGYPCLEVKEKLKNGRIITARYVIRGPDYYCISASSTLATKNWEPYFSSFRFTPYRYNESKQYVDTFLHFMVKTPVAPDLEASYREKLEKVTNEIAVHNYQGSSSYWPRSKNALFTSDSTGETIGVSIQQYPKYYTVKDSAKFWENEMGDYFDANDLVPLDKQPIMKGNAIAGYRFSLRDTGSSRIINRMILLNNSHMFSLVTIGDTLSEPSPFVTQFFNSFEPEERPLAKPIFAHHLDSFFIDLQSNDSAVYKKAQQNISNVHYGEKGAPKILKALQQLRHDKYYSDSKTKLIAELGYIKDTTTNVVVGMLEQLYEQTNDTSIFRNEVMKALARHKTRASINLFKEIVLQDPPVFDNEYDYTGIFNNLSDTLQLAASLYPDLLQLVGVDDYKKHVLSLLVTLVDSGYVNSTQYENYYSKLYFDARIELKKQQGKDEKKMNEEGNKDTEEEPLRNFSAPDQYNELSNYAILLMPFYEKEPNVQSFFDRLLRSKDDQVRLNAAITLIRNNRPVADSILYWFAEKDEWRGTLYTRLEAADQTGKFPEKFRTQLAIARSYLVADKNYSTLDSIAYIGRQLTGYRGKTGYIYFFKYRVKTGDDWKIGLSGLQPPIAGEVNSDNSLAMMTDKKIKKEVPELDQFREQLTRLLFTFRKSARNFFEGDNNSYRFTRAGEYEE